jgi:hypothetical protein
MKYRQTYKFWKKLNDLINSGNGHSALWEMFNRLDNGEFRCQRNSNFNVDALEYVLKEAGMGTPLAKFPSKSKPGKEYTVWEPNGGGDAYCDCWQWKRNRTCSHLENYHRNIQSPQHVDKGLPKVVKLNPAEASTDAGFDAQINEAVNEIINKS